MKGPSLNLVARSVVRPVRRGKAQTAALSTTAPVKDWQLLMCWTYHWTGSPHQPFLDMYVKGGSPNMPSCKLNLILQEEWPF